MYLMQFWAAPGEINNDWYEDKFQFRFKTMVWNLEYNNYVGKYEE